MRLLCKSLQIQLLVNPKSARHLLNQVWKKRLQAIAQWQSVRLSTERLRVRATEWIAVWRYLDKNVHLNRPGKNSRSTFRLHPAANCRHPTKNDDHRDFNAINIAHHGFALLTYADVAFRKKQADDRRSKLWRAATGSHERRASHVIWYVQPVYDHLWTWLVG